MKMKLPLPKPPVRQPIKKQNIEQLNKKLAQLSALFRQATAQKDYEAARKHVAEVLKYVPDHVVAMMDLAFTELRLERYEDAYRHYLKAISLSKARVDTNIYDGLTEVCYQLDKPDEVQKYGALALQSKKNQVNEQSTLNIPAERPVFNPARPQENIIAFSLFGSDPRYCETAWLNVIHAREIYPEWTCRIYLDDSVPDAVQHRLKNAGAQTVMVNEQQKQLSGLFWRFLVMDDPDVRFFMIRDADSLISCREKAAVQAWLDSSRWFHSMRDFYSHTELVLAGMWGGCHGVFHGIETMIQQYMQTGNYLTSRVVDQHFLRYMIWPALKQSLISHDSQGFDPDAVPFPEAVQQTDYEQAETFHVGSNMGAPVMIVKVEDAAAETVRWVLLDQENQEVCSYEAAVQDSREIMVNLPRIYTDNIQKKIWRIELYSV
ncbi:tetratricopeptide repeat protein [Acinetobacter chinensis]|uniref:Tetratricopeptide repeat protein n=1 Tax=Acinetobacter chinensis TaxID=2004650 RepID=A0A3B7LYJ6_9GAMM|nr:tetratricopeptide repeat protein [Acinetobacter chinensis]AXY55559.1 tetratricopeptide repeat protein [Acinetobacter chinensis]